MPLSEHEERILAEIERKLAEDDPRFVARTQARARRGWSRAFRLRLAAVLAVLGVVSVLSLTFSIVFGALGMILLLAAILLTVQAVKESEQRARSVVPPDERA
jgi:protein-S-isoprenylcysteine O-methyltransferase Ste14